MENEYANDNDGPFQTLAAVTARVLAHCQPKAENDDTDLQNQKPKERDAEQRREYVDQRLKEIAAFEERASGLRKRR